MEILYLTHSAFSHAQTDQDLVGFHGKSELYNIAAPLHNRVNNDNEAFTSHPLPFHMGNEGQRHLLVLIVCSLPRQSFASPQYHVTPGVGM